MPLFWSVLVGGGSGLLSVRLLALRVVRVVSAIVRSVATGFEVGDQICGEIFELVRNHLCFQLLQLIEIVSLLVILERTRLTLWSG